MTATGSDLLLELFSTGLLWKAFFHSADRRTIGRRLVSGPTGFPGLCNSTITPFPMSSVSCCCKASLNILAIGCPNMFDVVFNRSAGILSCPLARPLFSLFIARVTSAAVMGSVSGVGSPVNTVSPVTAGSLNRRLNWSVIRSLSSCATQMTRPASSCMRTLPAGVLDIYRTTRNILAPSCSLSTSDARWSNLLQTLSRSFRRRACRILMRCCSRL